MAFLGAFTADAAHFAQCLPGTDRLALFHRRAGHAAEPPDTARTVLDRHSGAPAAIGTGQHHCARRRALDGGILCAGIVDAVVGAPVAQGLVVDQLIAAVSIEHPARDRLHGSRRCRTAGRRGCTLQRGWFVHRARASLRRRGDRRCTPRCRGGCLGHIAYTVCGGFGRPFPCCFVLLWRGGGKPLIDAGGRGCAVRCLQARKVLVQLVAHGAHRPDPRRRCRHQTGQQCQCKPFVPQKFPDLFHVRYSNPSWFRLIF